MIRWLFLMPFVWLLDYIYGIFNTDFRQVYLAMQESLTNYLSMEVNKEVKNDKSK